jgi:transcription antitermination factor NusG
MRTTQLSRRELLDIAGDMTPPPALPHGEPRFGIVTLQPGRDLKAPKLAKRDGFHLYVASERTMGLNASHGWTCAIRPLFRGYGFVALPIGACDFDEDALRAVDGVASLMRRDRRLVTLPFAIVAGIHRAETDGLFDAVRQARASHARRKARFSPGAMVSITDGPFAGVIATVIKARSGDRLRVLLKAGAMSVEAEMDDRQLAPLDMRDVA